jgi:hypothetical protein
MRAISPQLAPPRGSAMVETVLALPVVLFFLVVVIGFGIGLKRLSPLQNAARFDSWRATTPGAPSPSDAQLAAAFYPKDTPASLVRSNRDGSLSATVDDPVKNALFGDAQTLATRLFDRFPRGSGSEFTVQHDSSLPILAQMGFTNPVKRHAYRLDGDWRFVDGITHLGQPWATYADGWHPTSDGPRIAPDIQELFLSPLDDALPPAGGSLSDAIRALYLAYPDYRGPNWFQNPAYPWGGWGGP